jgi:hypothetical protein
MYSGPPLDVRYTERSLIITRYNYISSVDICVPLTLFYKTLATNIALTTLTRRSNNVQPQPEKKIKSSMGIKSFFKTKPPSEEEVEAKMREDMLDRGLRVKHESKNKPNTFSAYAEYANDKAKAKKQYAPKGYGKDTDGNDENSQIGMSYNNNPYGGISSSGSSNPYSNGESGGNPYSQGSGGNPYSQGSESGGNPYGSTGSSNPYASQSKQNDNPYSSSSSNGAHSANPYTQQSTVSNSYVPNTSQRIKDPQKPSQFSFEADLEKTKSSQTGYVPGQYQQQQQYAEDLDLNDDHYAEEDLNDDGYRDDDIYQIHQQVAPETEEERLQREEDEEVLKVKDQIRFTKQESVASTRNTLRMAREAEESGKNTMGMLGAQSEALFNTERNLSLAETQDMMSRDKITQLNHYNRNILKPSVQNPFTKKRRLREKEEKIKNDRIAEKIEAERTRAQLSNSTQRIKSALDSGDGMGDEIAAKYRREKIKSQAKQYQFEADSEDDEMEGEIGENLDEIGKFAGRLKTLAVAQGEEIDKQNSRLRDIEERADKLDVNIHVNTARLRDVR